MSDLKKNDTDNKTAQSAEKICIHCGDSCGAGSLQEGENYFCCPGCRAVYNLLHDSNLDNYYHLENKPGLKPDRTASDNRFSYLDKDNIKEKMLDFNDGRTARVTFTIPQIHCSSCIWLLENLYRLNEHVLSSVIDFQKRIASITFDISKLSLKELVILLSSIGYEPEVRLSDNGVEKSSSMAFRTLYGRLAVAGFAFGNVMLLSFPEYLGFQSSVAQDYGFIFSWSKIVLSLPVVLYSGADFYIPALKSIRQKHINMDVPIMIGIAILFVRSLYEILAQGGAGYLDSLCALVFLLLVGRLYQKKTYFSLSFRRDYRSYLPISVLVRSNNQESYVPLDELEEGNRIIMRNHEVIPADSILIKGIGKIDYSFVTGESVPITVKSGEKVYAGGRQLGQSLELEIIKKPSRSYLMQLWEQTDQAIG
ncbi:MAG: heavy metal translocating P-type ATPase metal-binding domain-containing protein, partial [Candidatus Zixiibacteriota bacterium]